MFTAPYHDLHLLGVFPYRSEGSFLELFPNVLMVGVYNVGQELGVGYLRAGKSNLERSHIRCPVAKWHTQLQAPSNAVIDAELERSVESFFTLHHISSEYLDVVHSSNRRDHIESCGLHCAHVASQADG